LSFHNATLLNIELYIRGEEEDFLIITLIDAFYIMQDENGPEAP